MRRSKLTVDWLGVVAQQLRAADGSTVVLDSQAVAVAVVAPGETPVPLDWVDADWIGAPGTKRTFRAMFGPGTGSQLTTGTYRVWGRVIVDGTRTIAEPAYSLEVI